MSEYRAGGGSEWRAGLSTSTSSPYTYDFDTGTCTASFSRGFADVDPDLLDIERNLGQVVARGVTVTQYEYTFVCGPDGYAFSSPTRNVVVDLVLTGVGDTRRDAMRQTVCGDGESECQSIRVSAQRDAVADVTADGQSWTGLPGSLSLVHAIDAAAPQYNGGDRRASS